MTGKQILIEVIGWLSTVTFLFSILLPRRMSLHGWGMFTAVSTGIYSYAHGATAIWVNWVIAFFFHAYMWKKIKQTSTSNNEPTSFLK